MKTFVLEREGQVARQGDGRPGPGQVVFMDVAPSRTVERALAIALSVRKAWTGETP